MVAAEPEFGQVGQLVIFFHQMLGQMAVVIVDRFILRVAMIELASLFGAEEEILVNERSRRHWRYDSR